MSYYNEYDWYEHDTDCRCCECVTDEDCDCEECTRSRRHRITELEAEQIWEANQRALAITDNLMGGELSRKDEDAS